MVHKLLSVYIYTLLSLLNTEYPQLSYFILSCFFLLLYCPAIFYITWLGHTNCPNLLVVRLACRKKRLNLSLNVCIVWFWQGKA